MTMSIWMRLLLLGVVMPVLLGIFTYQGFFTNYTCCVFSEAGFEQQYFEDSIYRFRILGSHALLWTYQIVKDWPIAAFAPYALNVMDPQGDANFYFAYFVMNTFFQCLTCIGLTIVFMRHAEKPDFFHVDLPVFFLALLMGFTQFVITPYDTLSYCFIAFAILPIMKSPPRRLDNLILAVLLLLATLTRETAALILAFYVAVHYEKLFGRLHGLKMNVEQVRLIWLTLQFLSVYWALRWQFGMDHSTHKDFRLFLNFSGDPFPITGGVFFLSTLAMFLSDARSRKTLIVFLLASFPYCVAVFAFANPWEIRLWVPVIMLMVFIKLADGRYFLARD